MGLLFRTQCLESYLPRGMNGSVDADLDPLCLEAVSQRYLSKLSLLSLGRTTVILPLALQIALAPACASSIPRIQGNPATALTSSYLLPAGETASTTKPYSDDNRPDLTLHSPTCTVNNFHPVKSASRRTKLLHWL